MIRRYLVAAVMTLLLAAPAAAQDPHSTEGLSKLSSEELLACVKQWRLYMTDKMNHPNAAEFKSVVEYMGQVRDRAMEILAQRKGLPVSEAHWVPPTSPGEAPATPREGGATSKSGGDSTGGRGRGGSTQRIETNQPNRNSSNTTRLERPGDGSLKPRAEMAIALTVVATAQHIVNCSNRGISERECAGELALAAVEGAAVGTIITVISGSSGAVLVAAVAVGGYGLVTTLDAVAQLAGAVEAGQGDAAAQGAMRDQQARNAAQMTPERIQALIGRFAARAREIEALQMIESERGAALLMGNQGIRAAVEQSRILLTEFQQFNDHARSTAARCRDPKRNPLKYVVDLQSRAGRLGSLADRLSAELTDARTLAASCATAARARQALQTATRTKGEIDQLQRDSYGDVDDAINFFAAVKLGRASMDNAAARLAALEAQLTAAQKPARALAGGLESYRKARHDVIQATSSYLASIEALKGAFPDPAPPAIAEAIRRIGLGEVTRSMTALVYSNDELRRFEEDADTETNRIQGLIREARTRFEQLQICEGITDEAPAPLKALLTRLGQDFAALGTRVDAAMGMATEARRLIDACPTTSTDGVLTGSCRGVIQATPLQGKPGTALTLRIKIEPPEAAQVTRVDLDSPGCRDARCRATAMIGTGEFERQLAFQAPANASSVNGIIGTFRVRFQVFKGDDMICSGHSRELTVMAR